MYTHSRFRAAEDKLKDMKFSFRWTQSHTKWKLMRSIISVLQYNDGIFRWFHERRIENGDIPVVGCIPTQKLGTVQALLVWGWVERSKNLVHHQTSLEKNEIFLSHSELFSVCATKLKRIGCLQWLLFIPGFYWKVFFHWFFIQKIVEFIESFQISYFFPFFNLLRNV